MPDLQNHVITQTATSEQVGPSAVTKMLEWQVSGKVTDSTTGAQLATYNFIFPTVLTTLTAQQLSDFMALVNRFLITCETGY